MTNIIVLGIGGVGALVAYGIAYTNKSNLSMIVRSNYEKIITKGFDIESIDYGLVKNWVPKNVYPSIEAAANSNQIFDYIVICTKNLPEISKLEDIIEPILTEGKTSIVLIQNGIGIERPFIKKYPKNVVISGVSFIGSHNDNGKVTQFMHDKVLISHFENPYISKEYQELHARKFIECYSNEKIDIEYDPDVKFCRYKKLVYNGTLNTVACLTGVDTGRLYVSGATEKIVVPAMREVIKIAKADNVELPDDIVDIMIRADQPKWYSPSMLVDHKNNNPIELEIILGNLVARAHELNVEIPILSLLYELLKVVQFKLNESNGYISLPKERPLHEKAFK